MALTLAEKLARVMAGDAPAPGERALPSVGRQIANFTAAQVKHTIAGRVKADEATAAARLAICHACVGPGGYYRPSDGRCSAQSCGCWTDEKVRYASEACPVGKWGKVTGAVEPSKAISPPIDQWAFVTTGQLIADAVKLGASLPPDVDMVVSIARSGLLPGSIIATHLHLPLWTVSRIGGVGNPGHGTRMENKPFVEPKHIVLIDDTVAHGGEMTACLPIVQSRFPDARITRAVVYANPLGIHAIDRCVSIYPGLHFLEWNVMNSGHGQLACLDFDGILCDDCPVEDDDDGLRYARFLRDAKPLYLPRRIPVDTIVTGRHQKYEAETREWLTRHGVEIKNLIMRDWDIDPAQPWHEQHGRYKATHYEASGLPLFVESCPLQAEYIASTTKKPVLCPAAGRVFPG